VRTTVTLDPDTEQMLRERMKRRGISFKQALNESIREGNLQEPQPVRRTKAYPMGQASRDLTKALQIAADLEDEEILAKMRLGR
jgi:hypothetical protein